MSDSLLLDPLVPVSDSDLVRIPIHSIVRAVCEAAAGGPEVLYEVMLKMSLMVEATAPTYGLSIWTGVQGAKPSLRWAEGLEESEIDSGEEFVKKVFATKGRPAPVCTGDNSICLLLALPTCTEKAQPCMVDVYAHSTANQAKELNGLVDLAFLAHAHQLTALRRSRNLLRQ